MKIEKFGVYLADLNPHFGTEPGKIRPVTVVQTDLLNGTHPSTIVCPVTTQLTRDAYILRVRVARGEGGVDKESQVLVDQIRTIDNRRFIKRLGKLHIPTRDRLLENLRTLVLD